MAERRRSMTPPAAMPDDAVQVAHVGRPHGVRGEIRLTPESGDPHRLLGLTRAWVVPPDGGDAEALEIVSARAHQGVALVRFEGIDNPEDAARLTHADVWASGSELPARGADEFGVEDVLGATLHDGERRVGEVVGVSSGGGRDFLEVEVDGRRVLVPAVKDWLVELDRPGRRIVMRLPSGLLKD